MADTSPAARTAAGERTQLAHARIAIGALAVAAVLTAGVAPWFLGQHRGVAPAAAPGPTATSSPSAGASPPSATATPTVEPLPNYPARTPAPITAELSRRLRAAAVRLLPGATFGPFAIGFDDGGRLLAPFDVVDNDHGYYLGVAEIVNGRAAGLLTVLIWPGKAVPKAPDPGCDLADERRLSCEVRAGPDGATITVQTGRWAGDDITDFKVLVHRRDGLILVLTVNDAGARGAPADHTGVPMTTDQMVTLLLTPGLMLG